MSTYWLERAWLGGEDAAEGVLVTVEGARFAAVQPGVAEAPGDAEVLRGLTLPGMANCHSHAFHRALRGRTQQGRGTFWTWREQMYALAERLDPDSCYELARATYREMVAAGFTSVGEFHYLHHGPAGTPYDDPNAMGLALLQAARDAGIRIALLDACYLTGGVGTPVAGVQRRFSDGDTDAWAARVDSLAKRVDSLAARSGDDVVVGAAIHSVRAVPPDGLGAVADWAKAHDAPLHVHLSEQVAENDACLAAYGRTPTRLLEDAGVLGERTTAVHATHLTDEDVTTLGRTGTTACLCPTTERDLGDGIGPSRLLHGVGSPITIGSDSQAVVDPFEEMRAVELDERLARQERGHWSAAELLTAATVDGHRSLGFDAVGRIEAGARADLVTVELASPRTAGTGGALGTAVFAAGAADVVQVVRDGRVVWTAADRAGLGRQLEAAIGPLWEAR